MWSKKLGRCALYIKLRWCADTLYFTGTLIGLVLTALLMIIKLELIAEQVAIVVYYFLVVGTVLEILALRRQPRRKAVEAGKTTVKDNAG